MRLICRRVLEGMEIKMTCVTPCSDNWSDRAQTEQTYEEDWQIAAAALAHLGVTASHFEGERPTGDVHIPRALENCDCSQQRSAQPEKVFSACILALSRGDLPDSEQSGSGLRPVRL
jgi:hypothetical protein